MTKMNTNEATLNSLFDDLVDTFRKKLLDGTATAADMNVIRQFLKDNGIEFVADNTSTDTERKRLADILPFKAEDAEAA